VGGRKIVLEKVKDQEKRREQENHNFGRSDTGSERVKGLMGQFHFTSATVTARKGTQTNTNRAKIITVQLQGFQPTFLSSEQAR
jgi:hypothetical protein